MGNLSSIFGYFYLTHLGALHIFKGLNNIYCFLQCRRSRLKSKQKSKQKSKKRSQSESDSKSFFLTTLAAHETAIHPPTQDSFSLSFFNVGTPFGVHLFDHLLHTCILLVIQLNLQCTLLLIASKAYSVLQA